MRCRHMAAGFLGAIGILAGSSAQARSGIDVLNRLRGTARPIVVLADLSDDVRVVRQMSSLARAKGALANRNIKVLLEARPGSILRTRLGVAARGFAVVLVGKDGSVKEIWPEPVDPKQIFDLIDRMPMRRKEMLREEMRDRS